MNPEPQMPSQVEEKEFSLFGFFKKVENRALID